jgi:anti-sigma-K factor RskA
MIPENPDDLHALAGEYVLGVLDEPEAREVAGAVASNIKLRRAVIFWEQQLHPLSELAAPAEPPPDTWEAIEARVARPTLKRAAPQLGTTSRCGGGPLRGLPLPRRASHFGSR